MFVLRPPSDSEFGLDILLVLPLGLTTPASSLILLPTHHFPFPPHSTHPRTLSSSLASDGDRNVPPRPAGPIVVLLAAAPGLGSQKECSRFASGQQLKLSGYLIMDSRAVSAKREMANKPGWHKRRLFLFLSTLESSN
jgi:hypothetical protein